MTGFKNILVPVDLTVNTDAALCKATELASAAGTVLHLLHVLNPADDKTAVAARLREIENIIKSRGVNMQLHVHDQKKIEPAIISFAASLKPDIIIIGKTNHHSFFPSRNTVISASIVEETHCPVLTVNPFSSSSKMKAIVMPVSEFLPLKKITLLETFSSLVSLDVVHLLSVLMNDQKPDNHTNSALLQIMRSIRSRVKCRVQHTIVHSNNKAIATLAYAEEVGADTLLVSPEVETSITTWMYKKDSTNLHTPASRMQLLSVQPN